MPRTRQRPAPAAAGLCACVLLAAGCASPLGQESPDTLRESVRHAIKRELSEARQNPEPIRVTRESAEDQLGIDQDIIKELEANSGPEHYLRIDAPLGPSLYGDTQPVAYITLEDAIRSAVEHNLELQFARLTPAIRQSEVIQAEAAFDWVFFMNGQWARSDRETPSSSFTANFTDQQQWTLDTGLRRPLTTGGQLTIQHGVSYTDFSGETTFDPDPAYGADVTLQLDQPLLRGFGSDVSLSQIRLARNAERDAIEQLRSELLRVVTETEIAYWQLVQSRYNHQILEALLRRGEEVRQKLEGRRQLDVEPAQYADAVATKRQRLTNVINAQDNLRTASNNLKLLMNDPELTIGSEILVLPADRPADEPINYSLADALMTAFSKRPEVQRAILSIDDTSIRIDLADNARLPLLDFRAQVEFSALGENTDEAYDEIAEARFVDFLMSLVFEQPIGNRAAEANYKRRRIEQQQAVLAFNETLRGIVSEVKGPLYSVVRGHQRVSLAREARIAEAENLRTLIVKEETIESLTPEFLDLKLRRQERLAAAEQLEIQELINYNVAIANLARATGVALERNGIDFEIPDAVGIAPAEPLWPIIPWDFGAGAADDTPGDDTPGDDSPGDDSPGDVAPSDDASGGEEPDP